MGIQNIQTNYYAYTKTENLKAKVKEDGVVSAQVSYESQESQLYISDSLTVGTSAAIDTAAEKKLYKFDAQTIAAMKKELSEKSDSFKEMVRGMLEKQGLNVEIILKRLEHGESVNVKVDEESRKKAEEAISEDGFWGVKQTSERILNFAKALGNSNPEMVSKLRDSFKEGYEQAKEAFGGELPEISQRTYDAVMKGFDEWAEEGNPQSE